ncbi:MAG: hypothetical protein JXQ30_02635 [Spirochaetes bacterium]|nr:hypothetical protein [Spirochaetota bacterium]
MASLPQKQNKKKNSCTVYGLTLAAILLLASVPSASSADIIAYDPELDIAFGTFSYLMDDEPHMPDFRTGLYLGGYLSMKSPIFVYFFEAENVYNIFEAGFAVNEIVEPDRSFYMVNIPVSVDFAYRIPLFSRFSVLPFVGLGLGLSIGTGREGEGPPIYPFFKTGVELRYLLWDGTHMRIKIDYGVALVNEVEAGVMPFLRVRIPIPFIP